MDPITKIIIVSFLLAFLNVATAILGVASIVVGILAISRFHAYAVIISDLVEFGPGSAGIITGVGCLLIGSYSWCMIKRESPRLADKYMIAIFILMVTQTLVYSLILEYRPSAAASAASSFVSNYQNCTTDSCSKFVAVIEEQLNCCDFTEAPGVPSKCSDLSHVQLCDDAIKDFVTFNLNLLNGFLLGSIIVEMSCFILARIWRDYMRRSLSWTY